MISVVIPAYNEEENVKPLYDSIKQVLVKDYEIVFVDDGSGDNTFEELKKLHELDKKVRIVKFKGNFGQTAALDAGFKHASGDVVIAMDADLQNDPKDIPKLVGKLKEGYDCVSGWRAKRKDNLSKKFFSKISYVLRQILLNDGVHDSGCTLKAYRSKCFDGLDLYRDMHRYIPGLLKQRGFRITELQVEHHPRVHGKTKYNYKRLKRGLSDLIFIAFVAKKKKAPENRYVIEKVLK